VFDLLSLFTFFPRWNFLTLLEAFDFLEVPTGILPLTTTLAFTLGDFDLLFCCSILRFSFTSLYLLVHFLSFLLPCSLVSLHYYYCLFSLLFSFSHVPDVFSFPRFRFLIYVAFSRSSLLPYGTFSSFCIYWKCDCSWSVRCRDFHGEQILYFTLSWR